MLYIHTKKFYIVGFSCTTASRVQRMTGKTATTTTKSSEWQFCGWKGLLWERSQKIAQTGSSWQEGDSNWNNRTIAQWHAKEHPWTHITSNLEGAGLQQQKKTLDSSPVSSEEEKIRLVGTVAMDSKTVEKLPGQALTLTWIHVSFLPCFNA